MKTDNTIIAEFLGLEKKENYPCHNGTEFFDYAYYMKGTNYIPNTIPFSTNWNLLMEVVEKIETKYLVDIFGKAVSIHDKNGDMIVDQSATNSSTKIDAVYKACLSFIKWYNL